MNRKGTAEKATMWGDIVDLFKRSIIIQSLVTIMMVGTLCCIYLYPLFATGTIENIKLPELLVGFIGLVLGYWFKSKEQYNDEEKLKALIKQVIASTKEE